MKILHTADWHLGQQFYERDRLQEQSCFLEFLLSQIIQQQVDLLIIAGDIFDSAHPPRAAEQLYYNFITKLHGLGHCQALIIGGNHDSAPHLDAPSKLLSHLNVHVIGSLPENSQDAIFRFEAAGQKLCVAAVPFLRDRDVRRAIEGESFNAMEARTKAGIVKCYEEIAELCDKQPHEVLIATGHLTAMGGQVSDSERSVHIGNLCNISSAQFPAAFDYVALGHLHHPQAVGGHEHIRYSGSPIPLSFSESQEKELRLLTIESDHSLSQSAIAIPLARRLLRLKGSADEITQAIQEIEVSSDELSPWIEVTLTDGDISPMVNDQIRETASAKKTTVLKVGRELSASQLNPLPGEPSKAISEWEPLAVFEQRIDGYDGDLEPKTLKRCFNHVLEAVQEGGTS